MKFFFISDKLFPDSYTSEGHTLYPRIPIDRSYNEDDETERICVAPSIFGCLTAIPNVSIKEKLHVYELWSSDFYQPGKDQVSDAELTGEVWIMKPVRIFYKCSILIQKNHIVSVYQNFYDTANSCYPEFDSFVIPSFRYVNAESDDE